VDPSHHLYTFPSSLSIHLLFVVCYSDDDDDEAAVGLSQRH